MLEDSLTNEFLRPVRCGGIRPDTLGDYFCGLGLLTATANRLAGVRACWRGNALVLLSPDLNEESLVNALLKWEPQEYKRWWASDQKIDTKAKSDELLRKARNTVSDDAVALLDAHMVSAGGRKLNPLFGSGGNIGKRDLAKVWSEAKKLIGDPNAPSWLRFTLFGMHCAPLPPLPSSGTWFVYANNTYNSGQGWYREGQLSPWSFLLAMEGARLLSGTSSRRLSATASKFAAFPFLSFPAAAQTAGEQKIKRTAEFWAPLWEQPASLAEVRVLLARGQARLGAKGATAASDFALAALTTGADAGVAAFQQFSLRQTTSSQTHEALARQRITVADDPAMGSLSGLSSWIQRLPRDGPNDKPFYGIRGRVENVLIDLAAEPSDPARWQQLLLALAKTQFQIDRNRNLRETCLAVPGLSSLLFDRGWPSPTTEIQIARAVASIRSFSDGGSASVQGNIFGIEGDYVPQFATQRPTRVVWSEIAPLRSMARVVERRLIDAKAGEPIPLESSWHCSKVAIDAFIEGRVDDEQIGRWIPPLSLLVWQRHVKAHENQSTAQSGGNARLHDLFRPLFLPADGRGEHNRALAARYLFNLMRQGCWTEAIGLARRRLMVDKGVRIVDPPLDIECDGERIAAAMLIPMRPTEVDENLRYWILPGKDI